MSYAYRYPPPQAILSDQIQTVDCRVADVMLKACREHKELILTKAHRRYVLITG